uniref:Mon2_C domain-containing protein n=1 Tax=Ascaris lumbricoides TaxID=6252 RepID=A0A0M3HRX9_ASCLU
MYFNASVSTEDRSESWTRFFNQEIVDARACGPPIAFSPEDIDGCPTVSGLVKMHDFLEPRQHSQSFLIDVLPVGLLEPGRRTDSWTETTSALSRILQESVTSISRIALHNPQDPILASKQAALYLLLMKLERASLFIRSCFLGGFFSPTSSWEKGANGQFLWSQSRICQCQQEL